MTFRVAVLSLLLAALPLAQGPSSYTLYTAEGQRPIPFRTAGGVDVVALDQLATIFGLTLVEDSLAGGLSVRSRGQTILLIPGQSFASIGPGRIISLPGSVQRQGNSWQVPIEFIRLALGPALNTRVEIRRPARIILFGDVRYPQVTGTFERQGPNGRLTLEIQPGAPRRVTRENNRLVIRFDAVAISSTPVGNLAPELVAGIRASGSTLTIDLGPSTASFRAADPDETRMTIDFVAAGAAATPTPPPAAAAPAAPPAPPAPPVIETPAVVRTVVLDPGHGGDDLGARGPGGTTEKDLTLQIARRIKAAIESRIGLRVLLTRDADENVPVDRRTSFANNNKADLFISLHANASGRADHRGAQVLCLRLDDYKSLDFTPTSDLPVPVIGGGTRSIDVVPWDTAQIPFVTKSADLGAMLVRALGDRKVPMHSVPLARLPLRPLVATNMPAVMIELGFLTNADEEKALNGPDRSNAIVEAIVATIGNVRSGIPARQAAN